MFCCLMACMELSESVNIVAVGLFSANIACSALFMPISSVVYTEWWSDSHGAVG